jgi:hypothetical protein
MDLLEIASRVAATPLPDSGMVVRFAEPDPVVRREPTETEKLHSRYVQWLAGRRVEPKPSYWLAARS